MNAPEQIFNVANSHALATIVDASATRKIVASQDIFDEHGTKLWARGQPVSNALRQRLLERKLRQPLEACLRAEDGVTRLQLRAALIAFLESGHALVGAIDPWAELLLDEVQRLPLHAAVQLLLTAARATKPQVFDHAVRGMALAGAMRASTNPERCDVRIAMLGGLLHDLGEMYVNPQHLGGGKPLDVRGYQHVVTHPRVGELLLATMTDYPPALVRAVGEHHERLDGHGYPLRQASTTLSPLGRLLTVTEVALAISTAPTAPLMRTSFALRMIPGEFEEAWVDFFSDAAQRAGEDLDALSHEEAEDLLVQLALLDSEMAMAHKQAMSLADRANGSALVRDVAARAVLLLQRYRLGWNSVGLWSASQGAHARWNSVGLWSASPGADAAQGIFELGMTRNELRYRMRCIQRDCLWQHPDVDAEDAKHLQPLWDRLSGGASFDDAA